MPRDPQSPSRRDALKCLAAGGAGTLFVLSGGVLLPVDLATAKEGDATAAGTPLFVQLSDTHIGFAKDAYFDDDGKYLSDRLTDEVLKFVEQNRDRPFFLYLALTAPHANNERFLKLGNGQEVPDLGP